ncbi:TonB-dependent siderophore receptor [Robbsia sp. KACC 23696]|uniref:TonB-dependent siderophore receptor n=1 Tax=Robbsia sp. KACC 23696 TaxID=3149231 RepID=UPI00325C3142
MQHAQNFFKRRGTRGVSHHPRTKHALQTRFRPCRSPISRLILGLTLGAGAYTAASGAEIDTRERASQAMPEHVAPADTRTQQYEIAAAPLTRALNAFAERSGVQLIYTASLVAKKQSPGVRGRMTAIGALNALLRGTGLYARPGANAAFVLEPQKNVDRIDAADAPLSEGALPGVTVTSADNQTSNSANAALKTRTPLKSTPQSVTVIERKQMDDQNVQTVAQALRYTAGVVAETRGIGDRYDSLQMRGFGGFGGNASYINFLDGLKLGRGLSYAVPQIEQYGLQRIEVLRGPSSLLYGQANPGGVVIMESKLPEANHVNEIELEGGTHDRWQGAFDLGGSLGEDKKVLYRFVGLARDADTQVSGTKDQRLYFAPSVTFKPDSNTTLTLLASYQYDPANGYYGFLPRYGTVSYNRYGQIGTSFNDGDPDYDHFRRQQTSVGYSLTHRFDDTWTVRQNVRYMHMWSDYRTVYSSGYTNTTNRYLNRLTSASLEHVDSLSIDNQAEAHFQTGALQHTVLFGLDYQVAVSDRRLASGKAAALDITAPVYNLTIADPTLASYTRQRTDELGLYAQDQIRLGRWSFVFGGREDWSSTDANEYVKSTTSHQFDRAFTWRAGLVYEFANGLSPYFSYSRSFQPSTSGTTSSGALLKPTTGGQYELGVKYQPPGGHTATTLALYDLQQSNVATADPANSAYKVQTGKVHSRGIELESHVDLTSSLTLVGAYTYTSAWVAAANDSSLNHTPVAVPRQMVSLWADYTLHGGPLRNLGAGAGVRYIGSSYGASDDSFRVSSFTLFDLAIHYDWRNWRFGLNATNLFDRQYVAACASATQCFWGTRREVMGTARYQW